MRIETLATPDPPIAIRMAEIGGTWVRDGRAYECEISPHAAYRLVDARR